MLKTEFFFLNNLSDSSNNNICLFSALVVLLINFELKLLFSENIAIPLPGGAGSYHVLVSAGLVSLYAVKPDEATAFVIIIHGWQTLVTIIVGAISLLVSQSQYKNK